MKRHSEGFSHYLGRALFLIIILVFICFLVRLGHDLTGVVMALGGITASVFALSAGPRPAPHREAGG